MATGILLDHETQDEYLVTVDVSDRKDETGSPDTMTDDTHAITISVTDADDPGVVTFNHPYPLVGVEITPALKDQDGDTSDKSWEWRRSDSPNGPWSNVIHSSPEYTPINQDAGMHLQATVTYTDQTYGSGKKTHGVPQYPTDRKITFSQTVYAYHIYENSPHGHKDLLEGGPPLIDVLTGNIAPIDDTREVTFELTAGGDKYEIDQTGR